MRTDIFKEITRPRNQALWVFLAFQSGFMNAGGFLAVQRFVSHVTGYGTNVALSLEDRNYLVAFETVLALLCFCAGATYAGWLVDRRLIQKREPRLLTGLTSLALINAAIYFAELSGVLGPFGEKLELQHDYPLLFGLCFACGLQNGLFTGLTGGQVRTTHLTGPVTDIGLNFTKILTLPREHPDRAKLAATNWLRVKIVTAFSSGSLLAALVFSLVDFEGFAIPALISLFLVWYVRHLLKSAGPEPVENEPPAAVAADAPLDGDDKAAVWVSVGDGPAAGPGARASG